MTAPRRISVFDLPPTPDGRYSLAGGVVLHHRHQDHSPDAYRTSADGVRNISATGYVDLCPICFPPVAPPPKATRPRLPTLRPEGRVPEPIAPADDVVEATAGDVEAEGVGVE